MNSDDKDFRLEMEPPRPESARPESARPDPTRPGPTRPESANAESATPEPIRMQAHRTEPHGSQAAGTPQAAAASAKADLPPGAAIPANAVFPMSAAMLEQLITALTPRPFRKRHPILFWGFWVLLIVGVAGGIFAAGDEKTSIASEDSYAVVRVEGPILNTRPLLRWIEKVERDPAIKGVILRIDSPGGGAAASQELYEAIRSLGKKKPVVASMGSVAASGGLMVAMGAQHVVANPSTVTGSIGVRMDVPQLQGLMGKLGIGQETLTTGRLKDAGSATRPMTAEEKLYLGRILQDMHDQFVQLVAEGRKLPADKVRAVADGRIFTGREARELGIVDELGGQNEAVATLHKLLDRPKRLKRVEQPKESKLWKELMESLLGVDVTSLLGHTGAMTAPASGPVPAFLFAY